MDKGQGETMFNVTVLKMKDIKKYVIGMLVTTIVIITISQYLPKMLKEKRSLPQWVSENSMLGCLEQAVPTMASVNEEYKKIAEEEEITEDKFLQGILKTQVSSMQGIEKIETKEKTEVKEEAIQEPQPPKEENLALARKWCNNRGHYQ